MRSSKYLVPLQALAAFGVCLGLGWMMFVIAGFNPNPPSANDIQMRTTEDLSFESMNSTAAALAAQIVAAIPASTSTPLRSASSTPVSTSTDELVSIPVSGPSQSPTPTKSPLLSWLFPPTRTKEAEVPPTALPTSTSTPVPSPTPVPTITKSPTLTATEISTQTSAPSEMPLPTTVLPQPSPEPPPTNTPVTYP